MQRILTVILFAVLIQFVRCGTPHDGMVSDSLLPPEDTEPWRHWYWLNNDISKEGVTKDLEAMASVGIRRAMIGNIEGGGPVKMFSDEWYDVIHHALREANRLGV